MEDRVIDEHWDRLCFTVAESVMSISFIRSCVIGNLTL